MEIKAAVRLRAAKLANGRDMKFLGTHPETGEHLLLEVQMAAGLRIKPTQGNPIRPSLLAKPGSPFKTQKGQLATSGFRRLPSTIDEELAEGTIDDVLDAVNSNFNGNWKHHVDNKK